MEKGLRHYLDEPLYLMVMNRKKSTVFKDENFVSAMHRREMLVENRINRVRAGYFLLFFLMDSFVALDQYEFGPGAIATGAFVTIFMFGLFYAIHRLTTGAVYHSWIKYMSVSIDYLVLGGAFVVYHNFGHYLSAGDQETLGQFFQGEWVMLFALMFILINIASGLRFGRSIVLYSTVLTLAVNAYILYFGQIADQLFVYTMIVSAFSGVLTDALSKNIGQLFVKFLQRKRLMRFLSKDVVARFDAGEIDMELGGEMRVVTVLISDIRGFTSFSEGKDPQFVVKMLNEYLTGMTDVIFRHGGTIDKFIGDGILAVFGAPLDIEDHGLCAVQAANEMQLALDTLNKQWGKEGLVSLKMGIGLHSGEVLVGNIGSPERMEYTVIGDVVNLTSRIEGLTKSLGVPILFSEQLQSLLPETFQSEFVTETQVRGRDGLTRLYTL